MNELRAELGSRFRTKCSRFFVINDNDDQERMYMVPEG
jgi:hypothetical protein